MFRSSRWYNGLVLIVDQSEAKMELMLSDEMSISVSTGDRIELVTSVGKSYAFLVSDVAFVCPRPCRPDISSRQSLIYMSAPPTSSPEEGPRGLLLLDPAADRAGTNRTTHLYFLSGHGESTYFSALIRAYLNDRLVFGSAPLP